MIHVSCGKVLWHSGKGGEGDSFLFHDAYCKYLVFFSEILSCVLKKTSQLPIYHRVVSSVLLKDGHICSVAGLLAHVCYNRFLHLFCKKMVTLLFCYRLVTSVVPSTKPAMLRLAYLLPLPKTRSPWDSIIQLKLTWTRSNQIIPFGPDQTGQLCYDQIKLD